MTSLDILILSSHDSKSDDLLSLLKKSGKKLNVVDGISEASEIISNSETGLFLINYAAIVKSERAELGSLFRNAQKSKFVVYDVPDDATRRLAFYRLGAHCILDINYNVDDIYYFSVNTLSKMETDGGLRQAHFSGSLQDFNLAGLINIFGKEKRNGILRIQTPVSSGKIFFNEGSIYHAVAGNRREDDAVFYMLTWNKGWFSMRSLPVRAAKNNMQLSNIGLLLHGEHSRHEFISLSDTLGGLLRQVRIINRGDLVQREKDAVFKEFVEQLAEFRKMHEIIEFSPYGMLETLRCLIDLRKSNNLEFRELAGEIDELYVEEKHDKAGLAEKLLSEEEIVILRKNLRAEKLTQGKLVVLGTKTCGKSDFIRNFNQGSLSSVRTNQDLDFTKVELANDFFLQVFGLALDKRLTDIIETLAEGLVGYIFLIDAQMQDEFEYTNYIINHLMNLYPAPWAAAITNADKKDNKIVKTVKSGIKLPEQRTLKICDVSNKDDVKNLVLSIGVAQKAEKEK